jgi:hypothetical protein
VNHEEAIPERRLAQLLAIQLSFGDPLNSLIQMSLIFVPIAQGTSARMATPGRHWHRQQDRLRTGTTSSFGVIDRAGASQEA